MAATQKGIAGSRDTWHIVSEVHFWMWFHASCSMHSSIHAVMMCFEHVEKLSLLGSGNFNDPIILLGSGDMKVGVSFV